MSKRGSLLTYGGCLEGGGGGRSPSSYLCERKREREREREGDKETGSPWGFGCLEVAVPLNGCPQLAGRGCPERNAGTKAISQAGVIVF